MIMSKLTPVKSIRKYCFECKLKVIGNRKGVYKSVRLCPNIDCPLYPYRMGKNPNRRGIGGRNSCLNCGKHISYKRMYCDNRCKKAYYRKQKKENESEVD